MTNRAHDLAVLAACSPEERGVRRCDVAPGDVLVVKTRNSIYAVRLLSDGEFRVSGGWFDRTFGGPILTTIAGCTWGGTILQRDLIVACGMHLEFGNRVVTSAIQQVCHFPGRVLN